MDWVEVKSNLLGSYAWLPNLQVPGRTQPSKTLDEVIIEAARAVENSRPPYDPYRVEWLLEDISRLIDRIFAYRKEGYDLDVAATSWALDYELFKHTVDAHIRLEKAEHFDVVRRGDRVALTNAATAFAASADPLAPGFKALSSRSAEDDEKIADGERERQEAIDSKWALFKKYQDKLQERHNFPGGSLNFKSRLDRLVSLLVEDVQQAYLKARAAERGLKEVFFIHMPLPPLDGFFLEKFLLWARRVIRQLEIDQQDDIEFEHIIYLAQPRGDGQPSGVIEDYAGAMQPGNNGTLHVDLRHYFGTASLGAHLVVRGVGLSTSDSNPSDPTHKLYRLSAQVWPPPQKDLFSPLPAVEGSHGTRLEWVSRGPIFLTNISMTSPSEPVRMFRGPNVNNIDPRGLWIIQINKTLGFPNAAIHARNPNNIVDVKLHLLLAARPTKDYTAWRGGLAPGGRMIW
jgi:hypothetical protein